MKKLLCLFVLFSLNANALEKRTYTKLNSREAEVKIETENKDKIQSYVYVDGLENKRFIKDLLNDKKSILHKLKLEIEKENCNVPVAECGKVTITDDVRTSFGITDWITSGGSYSFFVGFTNAGDRRTFDVSHLVTLSEIAEAKTSNGRYTGITVKKLYLVNIRRIDELTP